MSMKRRIKKQMHAANAAFANNADVVLVTDDPREMKLPRGRYLMFDQVRGVAETVEVDSAGTQRVVDSKPLPIGPGDGREPEVIGAAGPFEAREVVVGSLYQAGATKYPEGAHASITPGGVELALFIDEPTAQEVRTIQGKDFEAYLVEQPNTMLFLAKFGDLWFEAPYNVHRVPSQFRAWPPAPSQGYGWPLAIVVVDARTGVVRAMRNLALSNRFSSATLRALAEQANRAADLDAHVREVIALRAKRFPELAATATTRFVLGETAN